jgi:general secretion pathway protein H
MELLVALAIMATILAVAIPALTSGEHTELKAAAGDVATALRQTRLQAQKETRPVALVIDVDKRSVFVGETAVKLNIPSDITIEMTTAESELTGDSSGGIRFFPDGSSTGGQITLWRNKQWIQLDIEWLTGRIRKKES